MNIKKKPSSYSKLKIIRTSFSSTVISSMKPCTTLSELALYASTLNTSSTWNTSFGSGSRWTSFGSKPKWRRWWCRWLVRFLICRVWGFAIVILSQLICSFWIMGRSKSSILENLKTCSSQEMTEETRQLPQLEEHRSTYLLFFGKLMWLTVTHVLRNTIFSSLMSFQWVCFSISSQWWKMSLDSIKKRRSTTVSNLLQLVSIGWETSTQSIYVTFLIWCWSFMKKTGLVVWKCIRSCFNIKNTNSMRVKTNLLNLFKIQILQLCKFKVDLWWIELGHLMTQRALENRHTTWQISCHRTIKVITISRLQWINLESEAPNKLLNAS